MFKIVILFALLSLMHLSSACRCIPDKTHLTPNYCRTQFLAIVKITHSDVDHNTGTQHNHFELIQDVTDFGEVKRTSLKGLTQSIDDTTSSCGHFLTVNQTYLIGASINGQQPFLTACGSYIEGWNLDAAQATARLADHKKHCGIPTHTN